MIVGKRGKKKMPFKIKDCKIKTFNSKKLKETAELYLEIFNNPPWNDDWTMEKASKRLKSILRAPGFHGFNLYKDNELMAFVLGNIEEWFDTKRFYLRELGVKPTFQGKGIGQFLIKKLHKRLKAKGITHIYLKTMRHGLTYKFYRKCKYAQDKKLILMSIDI